ncbi:MAG: MbtH family NRPS accessory protein [Dokdonella sp.]
MQTLHEERLVVVVNGEEEYALWRADQAIPLGWRNAGLEGSRQECLEFIQRVWTDMRPLSVRRHLGEV